MSTEWMKLISLGGVMALLLFHIMVTEGRLAALEKQIQNRILVLGRVE